MEDASHADGQTQGFPFAEGRDVNMRLLAAAGMYVRDVVGDTAYANLLERTGLTVERISDLGRFIGADQYAAFLAQVRLLVPDDEAFRAACTYRLGDAYGPARYVLWAGTPELVLNIAAKTINVVLPGARCETVSSSRNHLRLRYTSQYATETRLMCLARQAAVIAQPTLFGLPRATVREHKCVARGDDCCEYEVMFQTRPRWLPAVVAGGGGLLLAKLLQSTGVPDVSMELTLPLIAGLLVHAAELRRVFSGNLVVAAQVQRALQEVTHEGTSARIEIMEFHQRQRQWAALLEDQVDERTRALEDVHARIERLRAARTHDLLGFSHDLRNPLTILRASVSAIEAQGGDDAELSENLSDIRYAVGKMERLLGEMADTLSRDTGLAKRSPETLLVADLAHKVERRIAALLFGRDVRSCVHVAERAPRDFRADPLLVDRIVDNLLTNAAKYTERGHVDVEFNGSDHELTIRVSDTGRGMPAEQLARVFRPRGSTPEERAANSLGLGLSVVVRLLGGLGGKLEVESKQGKGTSFLVRLPRVMRTSMPPRVGEGADMDELLENVVQFGRAEREAVTD